MQSLLVAESAAWMCLKTYRRLWPTLREKVRDESEERIPPRVYHRYHSVGVRLPDVASVQDETSGGRSLSRSLRDLQVAKTG